MFRTKVLIPVLIGGIAVVAGIQSPAQANFTSPCLSGAIKERLNKG